MNLLRTMVHARIATRLAAALGVLMLLMIGVSSYSVKKLYDTTAVIQRLTERDGALLQLVTEWKSLVDINVLRIVTHSRLGTGDFPDQLMKDYTADSKKIDALQQRFRAAIDDPGLIAQYEQIDKLRKALLAYGPKILELRNSGDYYALEQLLQGDFEDTRKAYIASIEALQHAIQAMAQRAYADARADNHAAVLVSVGLVLASLVFAAAFGWRLSRSISRPIASVVRHAHAIAQGDLSNPVEVNADGEAGELQAALAQMQDSLRRMVAQVQQATENIRTASDEIATGNQDLSNRTEQAASSLQQTASSMEQLTGTLAQSAQHATQASQLARGAAEAAQRGGHVVSQVVSTMEEINASAKKIADIIGVIDGIAFQTNILALNAAVESARAGEHGRGFAVVAGEVRTLAQRSAQAAKEIKALIGNSVDKVENGARLVHDAGASMQDIVAAVQRVTDMIGDISASTREQSDGVGQINQAVAHLDQMTQQNAALVEQSAAAAASLREQAQRLADLASQFRLASACAV
ncbi:MAG: methyl-accepting chemotaxis protein [Caldimonas sp.]|uniref:methyl-accepting chemotaxis protein n=1 Tax=Caldimonas taiwanensis TaxID=307483 RepID=UPI000784AD83|nr:methyl-accepting chemotaxis protein [Caldimonas taiwanensis]GIX25689.1 MAG: methyl-accepting chemotaxis protein [Caldimonas sp.]